MANHVPRERRRVAAALVLASLGCAQTPSREEVSGELPARLEPTAAARSRESAVSALLATTGSVGWSHFGAPLAVDGDRLVVGARGTAGLHGGALHVYDRDAATGQWTGESLLAPGDLVEYFQFGRALAVDGDTVAASLPAGLLHGNPQAASVYLFERGAAGWGAPLKLTGGVLAGGGDVGASLALSGDLLAVGAMSAAGDGRVLLFERDQGGPGAWGQVATIQASDVADPGGGDEVFAAALALEGDRLLVGAPPLSRFGDRVGSAYLFVRAAGAWSFAERLAPAPVGGAEDGFGAPVDLEGDTAVIGAPWALAPEGGDSAGAAYVFRRQATEAEWLPVARVATEEAAAFDNFGAALDLDGDALVVGARTKHVGFTPDQGVAFVFRRDGAASDVWRERHKLVAADGAANDNLGEAVALHGTTAILGAPQREGGEENIHDHGAVYLAEAVEPPPVACQPAVEPTDTLQDGGSVVTASGFTVAAPVGSLPAPVDVWAEEVTPPATPIAGYTPLGGYYQVGARCTVSSAPGTSFEVTLPVPVGADPSRLSLAALIPAAHIHDGPRSGELWDEVEGVHDAAGAVYTAKVAGLLGEGMTFVLIEGPPAAPAVTRATGPVAPFADPPGCEGVSPFPVTCKTSDLNNCPAAVFERELGAAYDDYQAQQLPEPFMLRDGCQFTRVIVRDRADLGCEGTTGGKYQWLTYILRLCVDPAKPFSDAALRRIARHELFHAVSHGFPDWHSGAPAGAPHVPSSPLDEWITEGWAEAAVESGASMHRVTGGGRELRQGNVSLLSENGDAPYDAQDFWVHLFTATVDGVRRAYPLGQVRDLIAAGGSTEKVADAMRYRSDERYRDLGTEYWAWAKNQVYERTDVTFGGALTNPCQLDMDLVGRVERIVHPRSSELIGSFEQPLQTRVVGIRFRDAVQGAVIQAEGDNLAYKVYLRGEATSCVEVRDGSRFLGDLPAGSEVVVLLANKSWQTAREYKVSVFAE